jgi:hypothetical protein
MLKIVAMEALEAAVEKVDEISHIDELKLLTIALARNKAVDFLRKSLGDKRNKGKEKKSRTISRGQSGGLGD